jgi:hypothetical protein
MPHQAALTVRATIRPGQATALKAVLDRVGVETERRRLFPFEHLPVHFARLFVLDDSKDLTGAPLPATLFFLSDVDAPLGNYVKQVCERAAAGLDQVFSLCEGYPDQPTVESRIAYLEGHALEPAALYVNTVGRSLEQVRQEAVLRDAIADYLDKHASELAGTDASRLRAAIVEHVGREPHLRWALEPAAPPAAAWRRRQGVTAALQVVLAVVLLPVAVLLLPLFLVVLRIHEIRDKTIRQRATPSRIAELEAREDWIVQNQFTAIGLRKPGPFRAATVIIVLRILDFGCRHIFNRGSLAGVRTIHFARWVVIDGNRRILFASNYDGSLESYMDDFIDKVAFGLNAVFSNGVGYPQTNWLVLDGATDELAFKSLLRARQVPTPVWYSAYPDLTADNIANNAAIRAGLCRDLSPNEAEAWAARL